MKRAALATLAMLALFACATPRGADEDEKRAFVERNAASTLESFYAASPPLRERVAKAAGHAVFTNVNVKFLLLGTGHGYGLAVNGRNGRKTYMRMAQIGAGPGLGLTDVRLLFVFHDDRAFRSFLDKGLEVKGSAEATATAGEKGVAAETGASLGTSGGAATAGGKVGGAMAGSVGSGMEVYRITEAGLSANAQITGTRYWKDGKLN